MSDDVDRIVLEAWNKFVKSLGDIKGRSNFAATVVLNFDSRVFDQAVRHAVLEYGAIVREEKKYQDGSCPHCGKNVWDRCIPPADHTKCSFYVEDAS